MVQQSLRRTRPKLASAWTGLCWVAPANHLVCLPVFCRWH